MQRKQIRFKMHKNTTFVSQTFAFMQLRTPLEESPLTSQCQIDHSSHLICLGSCFAENIYHFLHENKFSVFTLKGTFFNPVSISKIIVSSLNNTPIDTGLFYERNGRFLHFDWPAHYHAASQEALLSILQQALDDLKKHLSEATHLVLIWGTAWVYLYENQIVSNCHKAPSAWFEKKLLTFEQLTKAFDDLMQALPKSLHVIHTLSPVRHLKDGLKNNLISKSIIRTAMFWAENKYVSLLQYFPAFELMQDDLRDYRFYTSDLIHPNTQALAYIYEYFERSFFSIETQNIVKKWLNIRKQIAHNPIDIFDPEYLKNLLTLLSKLKEITIFSVEDEIKIINEKIAMITQK